MYIHWTNAIPRITAGWAMSQDPPYAIHIGALPWGLGERFERSGLYVYKLETQKNDYGIEYYGTWPVWWFTGLIYNIDGFPMFSLCVLDSQRVCLFVVQHDWNYEDMKPYTALLCAVLTMHW